MSTLQLILVLVAVLVALHMAKKSAESAADRARYSREYMRAEPEPDELAVGTSVVIHTNDQRSIRGVVLNASPARVILASAKYLSGTEARTMGGTVRIPVSNIAFVQDLTSVVEGNVALDEGATV